MPAVQTLRICVDINRDELLRWYRGEARQLMATADNGARVALPVDVVRRFVTAEGVQGWFLLTIDDNNRFVSLRELGDPRPRRGLRAA